MARLYPRLGSCPRCGGTGRIPLPLQPGALLLIGDQTRTCWECRGLGTTVEEERAKREVLRGRMEALNL